MTERYSQIDRGATLVELALAFPIFCFLIFAVIDLSRVALGYSSVRSAVALATRRAAGVERIPWRSIDSVFGSNQRQPIGALARSALFQTSGGDVTFYRSAPEAARLNGEISKVEARAIAYAYQFLQKDAGAMNFPCRDNANCSWCLPLRGDAQLFDTLQSNEVSRIERVPLLGIECHYRVPIITSGFSLGAVPPAIDVSMRSYFPLDGYHREELGI